VNLFSRAVLAAGILLTLGTAMGQAVPANVAVPFYRPADVVQGMHRFWYAPRAEAFAAEAGKLPRAVERLCAADASAAAEALQQARGQWRSAALAWDTLAGVAVGPLLQRRSARQIDFAPTRPELIERAVRAAPADLRAMERVGTPAKGFAALEWLLWTRPVQPAAPACRYAMLAAQEIDAEAKALAQAFDAMARRDWAADEPAAIAAMAELLNQWVGGLEKLRWSQMEKPLRSAQAAGKPADYPRAASGSTRDSWLAQWQALQALATAADRQVPSPGAGTVPLESYLRGRGLNPLANKLAAASRQASAQLQAAAPTDANRTRSAARSVASLKKLAEAEVAPALDVNIGFSDSDGD